MPDTKITDLPDATLPLDYTEIGMVVQDGNNVQGAIDDLYAIPDLESGSVEVDVFGFSDVSTVTISYTRHGKLVVLDIPPISGTSDFSLFFLYNLPASLLPVAGTHMVDCPANFDRGGVDKPIVLAFIPYSVNIFGTPYTNGIEFFSDTGWNSSGSKGTSDRFQLVYNIL